MAVTELPAAIAETLEARVADGVLFFDHKRPGWASLVDLSDLDLSSPCLCVLGQVVGLGRVVDLALTGVWSAACGALGIDGQGGQDADLGLNADAPEILGDDVPELAYAAGYTDAALYLEAVSNLELAALQELWAAVIGPRQEAAGVSYRQQLARRQGARW